MQIKLGEKIKELRRRDGRRQEDLADALGVTKQAVSRWEASGAYPDTEMLPAIANYFHITIDELFGYNSDREIKLQSYMDQADALIDRMTDTDRTSYEDCVTLLRNALSEFPSEWRLQRRLAYVLSMYSQGNEDLKEAADLYEQILEKDIGEAERESAIICLISTYWYLGDYESAKRIASSQAPAIICREVLLARAAEGEERERYLGEEILLLLSKLRYALSNAVATLSDPQDGLGILLSLARLYESILSDGNCGQFHSDLCMTYLGCTVNSAKTGDLASAADYFDTAFGHFTKYNDHVNRAAQHKFTAPLVSKAKNVHTGVVILTGSIFEHTMRCVPAEFAAKLKGDPKYAPMFAQE